jgi:hypothetical protein
MMGLHRHRVEALHQFAKPAPDTIALGGGAVLLGNGKTDPDRTFIVAAAALQDESRAVYPRAIGNGEEIRPLPQPIHDEIPKRASPGSGAQTLAAASAAGGEDLAAAGGGEAGTEAVAALAHQFAGLISPLHGFFSADRAICLLNSESKVRKMRPKMGPFRPQKSRSRKKAGSSRTIRAAYKGPPRFRQRHAMSRKGRISLFPRGF